METETEKTGNSQATSNNFENLKYNPSENTGDILTDDSCDPDSIFFQTNFQSLICTLFTSRGISSAFR